VEAASKPALLSQVIGDRVCLQSSWRTGVGSCCQQGKHGAGFDEARRVQLPHGRLLAACLMLLCVLVLSPMHVLSLCVNWIHNLCLSEVLSSLPIRVCYCMLDNCAMYVTW
jgi:hypothetical protein